MIPYGGNTVEVLMCFLIEVKQLDCCMSCIFY